MTNNIPKLLGDPHLGRRFTTGVPLKMRGYREQTMQQDFVQGLRPEGADVHICMGDLFNETVVPYSAVFYAAALYSQTAAEFPGTTFYVIQGNHDKSRDGDVIAAWDLFCFIMAPVVNVVCVTEPLAVPGVGWFLPWHPTRTAVEQLGDGAEAVLYGLTTAYGHWDTDPRGAPHNLIPTKELAAVGITHAYTGHVHLPTTFRRDDVEVTVVGSMQPYAQGEDGGQGSVRYVTLDLERLHELLDVAPASLCNACVRLRLAAGEQFDGEIPECLSWSVERVRVEDEAPPEDASLEGFDTTRAAVAALGEQEIIPEVRAQLAEWWMETFGRALPLE